MSDSTYNQRVQRLTEIYRDDPILLALHESTTSSMDGRKWGYILASELAPPQLTQKQLVKKRRAEMKGSWRKHMNLPNANGNTNTNETNATNEIVEPRPVQ